MSYTTPDNDFSLYEDAVLHQLEKANVEAYTFMKEDDYFDILGVNIEDGKQYVKQIVSEFPDFVDRVRHREFSEAILKFCSLGKAELFYSADLRSVLSANAARYIYHSLLVIKQIKEKFPNQKVNLIEIGGGFGGDCFWIQAIAPECIQTYSIRDLPLVSRFQEKILSHLKVNCKWIMSLEKCSFDESPLFVYSAYSFSSLNRYYQDLFYKYFIQKSNGGFMVWNNWRGVYPFDFKYTQTRATPVLNSNTFIQW